MTTKNRIDYSIKMEVYDMFTQFDNLEEVRQLMYQTYRQVNQKHALVSYIEIDPRNLPITNK